MASELNTQVPHFSVQWTRYAGTDENDFPHSRYDSKAYDGNDVLYVLPAEHVLANEKRLLRDIQIDLR